jgi:hypothetical protein
MLLEKYDEPFRPPVQNVLEPPKAITAVTLRSDHEETNPYAGVWQSGESFLACFPYRFFIIAHLGFPLTVFDQTFQFAALVLFLDGFPLVEALLAFGKCHFHLHPTILEIEFQRNQ